MIFWGHTWIPTPVLPAVGLQESLLDHLTTTSILHYWYIAPQMEHSFSFLKFYMKVSSPWKFACA